MADNRESYDGESGFLTGYIGEVTDSYFQFNSNVNNMQLNLKNSTDNETQPEAIEQINAGPAWETFDGGQTVENADKTRFHANSRMQEFIDCCKTFPGLVDILAERGPAQHASVYLGLRFKWDEIAKPYSFKDKETGKLVEGVTRYNMPSAFLGTVDAPLTGEPTTSQSTSTGSSTSPVTDASALDGLPQDLIDQLTEARSLASTHSEFVDKAVQLTGVIGNTTLVQAIADEDQLWKELG